MLVAGPRGFHPKREPLADEQCPITKNFKPLCAEITVPLCCPPSPRWGTAAASPQGVQKLQSARLEFLGKEKEGLIIFSPMSYFGFLMLCYILYVIFMGGFYVIFFSSWLPGVPPCCPGVQAGPCWFPVAIGVTGYFQSDVSRLSPSHGHYEVTVAG